MKLLSGRYLIVLESLKRQGGRWKRVGGDRFIFRVLEVQSWTWGSVGPILRECFSSALLTCWTEEWEAEIRGLGVGAVKPGGVFLLHQWRPRGLSTLPGLCVTLGPTQVCIFSCVNENIEWIICHRVNPQLIESKYDSFVSFHGNHTLPY